MSYNVTWDEYRCDVRELIKKVSAHKSQYDCILAISRGGTVVGTVLSHRLKLPMAVIISESYNDEHEQKAVRLTRMLKPPSLKMRYCWIVRLIRKILKMINVKCLIVDDLLDTGKTIDAIRNNYKDWSFDTAMLFHKGKCKEPTYWVKKIEDWIKFPYEDFS